VRSVSEVIKRRHAGHMRVCVMTHYGGPQSEMLKRFGLAIDCQLVQIERHAAIEVLTRLLHRDFAYGVKLMPTTDAQGFALWLLEEFQAEENVFYTNGNWQADLESGSSWTPCTESTFDGGVIATSRGLAACIWFEDED
jgi:hypothetical protein